MRTLRRKHDRNHLYIMANGKCKICSKELDKDWQVDHIIPYSICGETKMSNLQALCKSCNLRKGNKIMYTLRKHQSDLIKVVKEKIEYIKNNGRNYDNPVADIVAEVFPGGGKSTHPIIAFKLLKEAGLVDKLCWVVPRSSLQEQGAESFLDVDFKNIFPHNLEIRETETSNDPNPTHGSDGYVTTYQALNTAISKNKNRKSCHQNEFEKNRYLLFLDECQHTTNERKNKIKEEEDSFGYFKSVKPLFDEAAFTIASSGTLYRHEKNEHVGFVDYEKQISWDGKEKHKAKVDLRYTIKDALKDSAIIPLYSNNGILNKVEYKYGDEKINHDSIKTNLDLSVALDTEYGQALLDSGIKHWQNYKKRENPRSKLIIIGHSQKHCKKIHKELKLRGFNPALAICDEKDAHASIKNFRKTNHCNILITVQMAYEGLDCKEATHIIALTKIRSIPWLIQMLTRIMRYDSKNKELKYKFQHAYAFVPNDKKMGEALKMLNAKEIPLVEDKQELPDLDLDLDSPYEASEIKMITEASSEMGGVVQGNLNGDELPSHLLPRILLYQNKYNLNQPEIDTYNMLRDAGILSQLDQFESTLDVQEEEDEVLTLRQKEFILRKEIQETTSKLDNKFRQEYGYWNKKCWNKFRKKRKEMNVEELLRVRTWMLEEAELEAKKINAQRIAQQKFASVTD